MINTCKALALALFLSSSAVQAQVAKELSTAETRVAAASLKMQARSIHKHCPGSSAAALERMGDSLDPPLTPDELITATEVETNLEKPFGKGALCDVLLAHETKAEDLLKEHGIHYMRPIGEQ